MQGGEVFMKKKKKKKNLYQQDLNQKKNLRMPFRMSKT